LELWHVVFNALCINFLAYSLSIERSVYATHRDLHDDLVLS